MLRYLELLNCILLARNGKGPFIKSILSSKLKKILYNFLTQLSSSDDNVRIQIIVFEIRKDLFYFTFS